MRSSHERGAHRARGREIPAHGPNLPSVWAVCERSRESDRRCVGGGLRREVPQLCSQEGNGDRRELDPTTSREIDECGGETLSVRRERCADSSSVNTRERIGGCAPHDQRLHTLDTCVRSWRAAARTKTRLRCQAPFPLLRTVQRSRFRGFSFRPEVFAGRRRAAGRGVTIGFSWQKRSFTSSGS